MRKILPLWWAWQWRVMVSVVLANFAFSLILLVLKPLLGLSQQNLLIISNIFSFFVTIYASIYFLDYVLRLRFKGFRIVILDETENIYKKAALK